MQKSIRPIPQTIAQCTQQIPNVTALRKSIDHIYTIALALLIFSMAGTALVGLGCLSEMQFGLFIGAAAFFIAELVSAFVLYVFQHIIFAFADLVEDQRICANLLLYHEGQANIERYQRAKEKQESIQ